MSARTHHSGMMMSCTHHSGMNLPTRDYREARLKADCVDEVQDQHQKDDALRRQRKSKREGACEPAQQIT